LAGPSSAAGLPRLTALLALALKAAEAFVAVVEWSTAALSFCAARTALAAHASQLAAAHAEEGNVDAGVQAAEPAQAAFRKTEPAPATFRKGALQDPGHVDVAAALSLRATASAAGTAPGEVFDAGTRAAALVGAAALIGSAACHAGATLAADTARFAGLARTATLAERATFRAAVVPTGAEALAAARSASQADIVDATPGVAEISGTARLAGPTAVQGLCRICSSGAAVRVASAAVSTVAATCIHAAGLASLLRLALAAVGAIGRALATRVIIVAGRGIPRRALVLFLRLLSAGCQEGEAEGERKSSGNERKTAKKNGVRSHEARPFDISVGERIAGSMRERPENLTLT
jgi:hypothetical protein